MSLLKKFFDEFVDNGRRVLPAVKDGLVRQDHGGVFRNEGDARGSDLSRLHDRVLGIHDGEPEVFVEEDCHREVREVDGQRVMIERKRSKVVIRIR